GRMTVSHSTLSGNAALVQVGGIENAGTMTVSNSTVSGNTASFGGGIYNTGTMTVSYSTVSGNTAATGARGISTILASTPMTLRGTIVANNTSGGDCSLPTPFSDGGYNLDSDGSCNLTQPTDISHTNPLLGPLANNGGPTQTIAIQPGSPAIDH